MAYFVLPGRGKRVYRLAIARRIVDGTARGARDRSPAGLARRRTRVLRRAMRPPRRLQIGLGPWLRALPARLPDPALTVALAKLDPGVRVAYVLLHIEGMPRYAVRDQLIELRVRRPWQVIEAAGAVEVPRSRRPARFEPVPVRPVRNRSPLPLVTAAALTAVLVGALLATERAPAPPDPGPPLRLVTAAPDAWRTARTLDAWPARGDLVRDGAFLRDAATAWAAETGADRPGGTAQLLYAGRVGGGPLAVMRSGDRLARYTPAGFDVVPAGTGPSAPIALPGGHWLLAPWDPAPESLDGAALPVRDGVTAPVAPATSCGRGPLFHLGSRTVGALGGPRAPDLAYRSPDHRTSGGTAPERLGAQGRDFWNRLGCLTADRGRPVAEAVAWDFWSGRLPYGGGRADWACTRLTFADGTGSSEAMLLTGGERRRTGPCDVRRPVSGTWWTAPDGRRRYLAAAARGLTPHVDAGLRTRTEERLLIGTSADPGKPVDLTVRDRDR
ncbi:hypothetical protein [Actinomadura algeriensis]|uniref:DNA-directed RNA polymerase specialized sigma24 family protein n=1 Tax=Actinomadura algeriensis TaxID=1679523 RepID=A0ABR9K423_9ACTN|nr:hypothetical protein [Actinomadura algeriensis]MBE1537433.1 hypothetical protein [Actinomadura algeriensis]